MNELLKLTLVGIGSVVALFIIAKLLGKRQIAQLDFADYVIGISIGSIAAEMSTDVGDRPFYYYLIAIAIYFLFDLIINCLGRTSPVLKHLLKGKPIIIIYEGQINYKNLKKSKMSINDIIALAREQGYFDISEIAYAILENSGKLSVLPKGNKRPTVAEDLNINLTQASLPTYLIVDGKISYSSLSDLNKDEKWLNSKLKLKDNQSIDDIILAVYDDDKDSVFIHFKEQ